MKDDETLKYIKRYAILLACLLIAISFYFILYRSDIFLGKIRSVLGIVNPFIYGAVMAYLFAPLCRWIKKFFTGKLKMGDRVAKGIAIFFTIIIVLATITTVVMLILPQLGRSIVGIANAAPGEIANLNEKLHNFLSDKPDAQAAWDNISAETLKRITSWFDNDLIPTAQMLIGGVGTQVINVVSFFKNIILGLVASIYFLWSGGRLKSQVNMFLCSVLSDKWITLVKDELNYADRMFSGFLIGKILDSLIIAIITFICTSLIGISSPILVSTIIGVTNIIPFFGPIFGAIPCALLILLESPIRCLYFLIFAVVIQQVDGQIIGPRILGKSVGLSGLWILFAIIFFGGLYGFVGMVIGVPLFTVIYDIARKLIYYGLRKKGREDLITTHNSSFKRL